MLENKKELFEKIFLDLMFLIAALFLVFLVNVNHVKAAENNDYGYLTISGPYTDISDMKEYEFTHIYNTIYSLTEYETVLFIETDGDVCYWLGTYFRNNKTGKISFATNCLRCVSNIGTAPSGAKRKAEYECYSYYIASSLIKYSTNMKVFASANDAISYLETGVDNSINKNIEEDGTLDTKSEIPRLAFDNVGYGANITNATDDMYVEVQGRWYSVDDVELYKENAMWKYKYSTLIKSELTTWVGYSDHKKAEEKLDFRELGSAAFQKFLQDYPVDSRTYTGGTNSLGNYFSGYSDALTNFKAFLQQPEYIFNGLEVYVRFYWTDADGNIKYSKWTHWYDNLASPSGSSGSQWDDKQNMFTQNQSDTGLDNEQKNHMESTGTSRNDTDVITQYVNNTSEEIATNKIWDVMQNMIQYMGSFPSLVKSVLGFLPAWIFELMAVGIGFIIVLRFLGR